MKTNGKQTHKTLEKSQQQRESEAMARSAAERIFASPEPAEEKPVQAGEPTLEQRMADIDRRSRERAVDEKRALAQHYVNEARNKFKRAVSNTTDDAVKIAYEELQKLERMTGDSPTSSSRPAVSIGGDEPATSRRERRSPEALRTDAEKLVEYLRENGPSRSGDVMRATGVTIKLPLNLRTFVEKYLPGAKVKVEGQRALTVYSV